MLFEYAITDISEYHDEKSYFLWVFFRMRTAIKHSGCPLTRRPTPSMFSDTYPLSKVFNPSTFMNECNLDWNIPRIIFIPTHMKYEINDDKWEICSNVKTSFLFDPIADEIMSTFLPKNKNHILVTSKMQISPEWLSKEPETLEIEKERLIKDEAYDDYFYDKKRDGGLWCSGISMHDDMDSCYNYQLSHKETCKGCRRISFS